MGSVADRNAFMVDGAERVRNGDGPAAVGATGLAVVRDGRRDCILQLGAAVHAIRARFPPAARIVVEDKEARTVFENGFRRMLEAIEPKVVVVYGSTNMPVFDEARLTGAKVVGFEDATSAAHRMKGSDHGVR